jgi:hypothetical protein
VVAVGGGAGDEIGANGKIPDDNGEDGRDRKGADEKNDS